MSTFYKFIKENLLLATIDLARENKSSLLNLSHFDMKEIPPMLLQLKDLKKLYLNKNQLKNLPEEFWKLTNLRILALDYNFLTCVPSDLGKLLFLTCLNLSHNNLVELTPEIGVLTRLEVLWINHSHLESLPPEIGNCTYLDTLGARGNFIKQLPPEIGKLSRLRWLTLEGNLLMDIPEEVGALPSLVHLNLSNNQFQVFPKLDELQALQYLFLSQNFILQVDVEMIEKMSYIKKIDLTDNPITNSSACSHVRNLKLDLPAEEVEEEQDNSESEDWEESALSSDLDLSESSVEEIPLDDILETALPQVAKFSASGV